MDRPKRPGSMSDADRALRRLRHRTPLGVPVAIDPELTPPPCEPPRPEAQPDFESIPLPIKEQLTLLADGLGDVTRALGKVWDARKDGDRLDRIEAKLGTLAEYATRHQTMLDEYVGPQIDRWRAATDEIARDMPRIAASLEQMTLIVRDMDRRLRDLELDTRSRNERTLAEHAAIVARVEVVEAGRATQEIRIAKLERDRRDEQVKATALAKIERRKTSIGAALVAFASGIASSFIK